MECTASFHGVAIRVPMRFHPAELSDFRVPHDGMGAVASASFRHRVDLVQRLHPPGTPQPLPSLLQPSRSGCWTRCAWVLAKMLVAVFAPTGIIELAVDDTLCRKRGLTVYGTGMHHDPLISSRAKPLTSWGHDWVVLTLIVRCPFWAPTKVWSLPHRLSAVSQSPGPDQGKEEGEGKEAEAASATPTIAPGRNWPWS